MRSRPILIALVVLVLAAVIGGGIALSNRRGKSGIGAVGAPPTAPADSARELDETQASARSSTVQPPAVPTPARTRFRVVELGTKAPIAQASLRIEPGHGDDVLLVTDDQGSTWCDKTALAEARVEIRAAGWCTARHDVPDPPGDLVEYELCTAGDVAVHVRTEAGAPLPNVPIQPVLSQRDVPDAVRKGLQAAWPNWYDRKAEAPTDANGDKRIRGMPRGIQLTFTAISASTTVTLDRTTPVTNVEIVVPLERCIVGRLVWEDRTAAGELIDVECIDRASSSAAPARALAQRDGKFRLCGVPAGRVNWRIRYPGELSRCTRIDSGTVDVGDIVLRRSHLCHGRVQYRGAPPDADYLGTAVYASQSGRVLSIQRFVQKEGTFQVRIPPGPAVLLVQAGGKAVKSVDVVSPFEGLVIELEPGGRVRIDHVPEKKGEEVRLCLHEPPASWSLDRPAGDRSRFFTTRAAYSLRWCEDSLCVMDAPPGDSDVYMRSGESVRFLGHVVVVAGEEVVLDAALAQSSTLDVSVHDPDGKPRAGIEIEAWLAAGMSENFPRTTGQSDVDGRVVLADLAPGRWLVYPRVRGPYGNDVQVVDLAPASTAAVEFTVGAPGTLAGHVTEGDKPAPGISISLSLADTDRLSTRSTLGPLKTDPQGDFRFEKVLAGEYRVLLGRQAEGTPSVRYTSRCVDVRAGEEARCDVDLLGSYRRIVFQRDGRPCDTLDSASVWTADGLHSVERRPELGEGWWAGIRAGPCLFVAWSKDMPKLDDYVTNRPSEYAFVRSLEVSSAPIVVDFRGARVDVRVSGENVPMPFARLVSLEGFSQSEPFLFKRQLAYADADGVRSFQHLPVGATVVLESDPLWPGPAQSMEVKATGEHTFDVTWPPH